MFSGVTPCRQCSGRAAAEAVDECKIGAFGCFMSTMDQPRHSTVQNLHFAVPGGSTYEDDAIVLDTRCKYIYIYVKQANGRPILSRVL